MPWVRYAVPEEFIVGAGDAVDWGREVETTAPHVAVRFFEAWVDDSDDIYRAQRQLQAYAAGQNYVTETGGTTVNEWQNSLWRNWNTTTYSITSTGVPNAYYNRHDGQTLRPPVQRRDREAILAEQEEWARIRHERNLRIQAEMDERREREMAAHQRALDLLKLVLSPEELANYEEDESIVIRGSDGKLYEIIQDGYEGNVYQLCDQGINRMVRMCAHPTMCIYHKDHRRERLPEADAWVAQVLALKADAEGFLATANIQWRRREGDPLITDPALAPRPRLGGIIAA